MRDVGAKYKEFHVANAIHGGAAAAILSAYARLARIVRNGRPRHRAACASLDHLDLATAVALDAQEPRGECAERFVEIVGAVASPVAPRPHKRYHRLVSGQFYCPQERTGNALCARVRLSLPFTLTRSGKRV
jgi:hypothetical protein